MDVMNVAYPITALYLRPFVLWLYWRGVCPSWPANVWPVNQGLKVPM